MKEPNSISPCNTVHQSLLAVLLSGDLKSRTMLKRMANHEKWRSYFQTESFCLEEHTRQKRRIGVLWPEAPTFTIVERTLFLHWTDLELLSKKINWPMSSNFWTAVCLINLLMQILCCPDGCCFVISFEIKNCKTMGFYFLFQHCFGPSESFEFL